MAYRPVRSWIANRIARHAVLPILHRRQALQFEQRCRSARRVQLDLLQKLVQFGGETALGRDFGLGHVRSVADFRRQLPIAGYDHFVPYIDRVAAGETSALFPAREEILTFVQTSATTGKPKLFPANRTWFQYYQRGWDVWGVQAFTDHPDMFGLPILQLSTSWKLGTTAGGHNISVSSALIERYQSHFVRKHYALPPQVTQIKDSNARGYTIARIAAMGPIGLMSTVTPSLFLRIADCVREFGPQLVHDLQHGTLDRAFDIPAEIRPVLERLVARPRPRRAAELAAILKANGQLLPRDIWAPKLISCWLGGTAGLQSARIPEVWGPAPLRDQGLLSSEGRHTLPLADGVPFGPLTIDANFYEFIPVREAESAQPVVLEAHELEEGQDYQLIFSTFGGLYRYDIGDIVRCRGWYGEAPVLEFLQKAGGYCDLEGEKLSALTVCAAMAAAEQQTGLSLRYFTVAPLRRPQELPRYAVLIEQNEIPDLDQGLRLVRAFDQELRRTVLIYGNTRNNRILGAPLLVRLEPGSWTRLIEFEVQGRGANETQYKHKPLVADLHYLNKVSVVDLHDSATEPIVRRAA
jgi:hypothetical protein